MGSCASVNRNPDSSGNYRASIVHSDSGNRPDSMLEKVKPESISGGDDQRVNSVVYRSQVSPLDSVPCFSNHGSKEDAFFDSQPWLESDCEDDFYSVNGEFTPSRGSTPLHSSIAGTPLSVTMSARINRALLEGKPPAYHEPNPLSHGSAPLYKSVPSSQNPWGSATGSPSTENKKKRLSDLFRESIRENPLYESDHQTEAEAMRQSSPTKSSPYTSGGDSGQRTPSKSKPLEKKHVRSAQCCFPRLPKKTAVAAPPAIAVDA